MMRHLYFLCVLISTNTFIISTSAQDPDPDGDSLKFDKFKNQVCLYNPPFRGESEFGYRWMEEMDHDEVLELAFVNMAYGLSSDAIAFRHEELGWRKNIIDYLALITKATCTDKVVAEQFLNSAKSLFLHYLRKYDFFLGNQTVENEEVEKIRKEEWDEILDSLKTCAAQVTPINILTDCGLAISYTGTDGHINPIYEDSEQFDVSINALGGKIDWVIENIWWMFQTTYARCYSFFYPNEDVILLFYQMFREDFLNYFSVRWGSVGANGVHFPMIFGPYDSTTSAMNMRKCATAAYHYEGLQDRQLVRPVSVKVGNVQVRNFRIAERVPYDP